MRNPHMIEETWLRDQKSFQLRYEQTRNVDDPFHPLRFLNTNKSSFQTLGLKRFLGHVADIPLPMVYLRYLSGLPDTAVSHIHSDRPP